MNRNRVKESQIIAIGIVVNFIFIAFSINYYLNELQLNKIGGLPQPFSILGYDAFMDYYNVNFHALTTNFYGEPFQSVYTFIFRFFSKLLTRIECIGLLSSIELKACDGNYILFFLLVYVLNIYLLMKLLDKYKNKYLWVILFMTSFPMCYTFERGNYIILTMAFISMILFSNNKKYFELGVIILPLTKLYFIANYVIFMTNSIKKPVINILIFILIMLIGGLIYDENQFIIFINMFKFYGKEPNIFEILTATSIFPIVKYTSIFSLKCAVLIFFLFLLARFYIFTCHLVERNLSLLDYKYLILLILLLILIIIESIGFYAIILLYPFFAYLIGKNLISMDEKLLIILISIPYPINLFEYQYFQNEYQTNIQLHSILIPILLILLFLKLTKKVRFYGN